MNWKKIISLLIVAVFVLSALAAISGQTRAQEGQYVQEIRLEVRTSQSVGIGDTAVGDLDMFIQTVPGNTYEGISDDWKSNLGTARSVGSYNNLFFNPYFDTELEEPVAQPGGNWEFNPFGDRQIRRATQWLIDREHIIEDMYGGYGMARYTPIGPNDPGYNEYIRPVVEDMGITVTGDRDRASDMIQEAMEYWEENLETGELRREDGMWQYRGPDQDWETITIEAIIRIEDERRMIGEYFCDLLEDEGFDTNRNFWDRRQAIVTAFYSDPADMQYHFYTGGWLASTAAKYQYWAMPQMYSPFYAYMPGSQIPGLWQYEDASLEMGEINETVAELDEVGEALYLQRVEDEEEYWELNAEMAEMGMMESVRVFIMDSLDFYPYNAERVGAFATDAVTGYSDIYTMRTMKTEDGSFVGGQFSSEGNLYMDNWNNYGGLSDVYGQQQKRLTHDYGVYYHPSTGEPIDMRAETNVEHDFNWEEGELEKNVDVPEEAVVYDPLENEWEEVGGDVKAASAVTYDWNFDEVTQNWHSGHEMTNMDIAHVLGFMWRTAYETAEEPEWYISEIAGLNRPWLENIQGIEWHGEREGFTVYGDYAFPIESMISQYYSVSHYEPWQVTHAAMHNVVGSEYAPGDTTYGWSTGTAEEWIHFLSASHADDFVDTLQNMVDAGIDGIPPYLREDNGLPFGYNESDLDRFEDEVQAIADFVDEYRHINIGNGPFMVTDFDEDDMTMSFERFSQEDGYPWPEDYWEDKLIVRRLEFTGITSPSVINQGDAVDVSASGRIVETYPQRLRRSPTDDDNATVGWRLEDADGNLVEEGDATFSNGRYGFELSSSLTEGLEAGSYSLVVSGSIPAQVVDSSWSRTIIVEEDEEPTPGISVSNFEVDPDSGTAPLEVTITATVTNDGEEAQDVSVLVDGSAIETVTVNAGDSEDIDVDHTFEEAGDYEVQIGDQTTTVSVEAEAETPGFTLGLLVISAAIALVVYHKKRRK